MSFLQWESEPSLGFFHISKYFDISLATQDFVHAGGVSLHRGAHQECAPRLQ